jgi:uncharacterized membrane protein YjdF
MTLDYKAFYTEVIHYLQNNCYISIAMGGVLLLLLFRKPKLFFTLVLIAALNISALYVISKISSSGEVRKKTLIQKAILREPY